MLLKNDLFKYIDKKAKENYMDELSSDFMKKKNLLRLSLFKDAAAFFTIIFILIASNVSLIIPLGVLFFSFVVLYKSFMLYRAAVQEEYISILFHSESVGRDKRMDILRQVSTILDASDRTYTLQSKIG